MRRRWSRWCICLRAWYNFGGSQLLGCTLVRCVSDEQGEEQRRPQDEHESGQEVVGGRHPSKLRSVTCMMCSEFWCVCGLWCGQSRGRGDCVERCVKKSTTLCVFSCPSDHVAPTRSGRLAGDDGFLLAALFAAAAPSFVPSFVLPITRWLTYSHGL